jgi:hypothetical protein
MKKSRRDNFCRKNYFVLGQQFDCGILIFANIRRVEQFRFFSHPALHFRSFKEELLRFQRKIQLLPALGSRIAQLVPILCQFFAPFDDLHFIHLRNEFNFVENYDICTKIPRLSVGVSDLSEPVQQPTCDRWRVHGLSVPLPISGAFCLTIEPCASLGPIFRTWQPVPCP